MEVPEVGRSAEGEEDFHDCPEELVETNGVAEEDEEDNVHEAAGGTEEVEGSGAASDEEGAGAAGDDVELDEETLLEMEKGLPAEEREERRQQSTQLKEEGNELFKKGDYVEAEDIYSQALLKCPASYQKERAILYSNRAAARLKQDKTEPAITDCTKAIELNPDYIRALLRRAELYEKTDKLDEALADYKSVMEKDLSCRQAKEACMRLPRQIEERNERLKEEMMSKLKDLGNLVLKPFGLSTQNFQVNQDASTGSYSINFVQNRDNNR
ncbi:tetratricopeptide repeat protein 1 [Bufo gargarizans]|uniref:tetratricopeptide repeat protein 1 n=1 Tax=Bufo gargarizans TaxID=30331 RepID=UPI001CF579FB|nr:tetratricopeptide repeat protein 1 [Bufo gargarizans]